jgi:hypothetical protein
MNRERTPLPFKRDFKWRVACWACRLVHTPLAEMVWGCFGYPPITLRWDDENGMPVQELTIVRDGKQRQCR